jgi:predicted nucleic acid-binding protein
LLRVVLGEPNRLERWETIQPISSELLRVECLRTVDRYRAMGAYDDETVARLRQELIEHIAAFDTVPLTRSVLERAADPLPVCVATLDALHLATAVLLREDMAELNLATHDAKLAGAARSLGFTVIGSP